MNLSEVKMSDVIDAQEIKEFNIEIKISNKNLQYKSDFSEPETIFWLEAVKSLIIKNSFDQSGMTASE